MAGNENSGRKTKNSNGEKRDKEIKLRISENELAYVDKVGRHRKKKGSKRYSRTDLLVLGARFIYGDVTLLDNDISETL